MKKIKILNKIMFRNLIKNKKQTLTIILSLIIIITSVFSVLLLLSSYQKYMINSVLRKNNWDTEISGVRYEDCGKLEDNEDITEISKTFSMGKIDMLSPGITTMYLDLYAYDQNAIKNILPANLQAGRLPEKPQEIVISVSGKTDNVITLGTNYYEIGDKIKLNDIEYTIVGVLNESKYDTGNMKEYTYGAITYLDESSLKNTDLVDIYISNKNIKNVYDTSKNIVDNLKISEDNISYNEELLSYSLVSNSKFKESFYLIAVTLLLTIGVSSMILIYTTLSILLNSRKKEIGQLLSIGCNKLQIRKMILFEIFILTLITIPISFLLSLGIVKIILSSITNLLNNLIIQDYSIFVDGASVPLNISISYEYIMFAIILILFTIFISSIIPAIKISKISPIEAIKETNKINLKNKVNNKKYLLSRFISNEAEIENKYLRRIKKNTSAIIISLIICVMVLIIGSNYISNIYARMENEKIAYNYLIYDTSEKTITDLKNKNLVKTYYTEERLRNLHLDIPEEKINQELIDFKNSNKDLIGAFSDITNLEKIRLSTTLFTVVESKEYNELLNKLGIEELKNGECVLLNNINLPNSINIHVTNYKENETISLLYTSLIDQLNPDYLKGTMLDDENVTVDNYNAQAIKNIDLKIKKVTDDLYGYFNYTNFNDLLVSPVAILVNEDTLKSINKELNRQYNEFYNYNLGETSSFIETNLYVDSTNPDEVDKYLDENNIAGMNYQKQNESKRSKSMIVEVFLYGFVILIGICTFLNIFNIIYANITSRKKDFAILKSLGMTKKQLNKMLRFEGWYYSIISLVIGLSLGILTFVIIYKIEYEISNHYLYDLYISWQSVLICVVFVISSIFLAILISKRNIKYESLIDILKKDE